MDKNKAVVYLRVATPEQIDHAGAEKNAWLFFRKSVVTDEQSFQEQQESLREKCKRDGYHVMGETTLFGDSRFSRMVIDGIAGNDIRYIISPSAAMLTRKHSEALEIFDMLSQKGIQFISPETEILLKNESPVRGILETTAFDFSAFGGGYDENGETEWDYEEDEEPDEAPQFRM